MPKDEFDFEDPLELNGMVFPTSEDTTGAMCDCFIEEFMRMGYGSKQILALFRNPHYLGMHSVLEKRGEPFVRDAIAEIFARWGRQVAWSSGAVTSPESVPKIERPSAEGAPQLVSMDAGLTDPMGAAVPEINL